MMVDEQWSVRGNRRFVWWGNRLAQHVWAEPVREIVGDEIVRVHAETDLLRNVPDSARTARVVAAANTHASLSALVWDRGRGRVSLRCSVYVHAQNISWLTLTFSGVVALQAADAYIKVDRLAELLGGEPDESQHPVGGPRVIADDMLNAVARLPRGEGPSAFTREDFDSTLAVTPAPWIEAKVDDGGLIAVFPFPGYTPPTSVLVVDCEERNPQLGNGVLLVLRLPVTLGAEETAVLASELNAAETTEWTHSHHLGAWCVDPGTNGVAFVAFVPSALHRPGLLENLAFSMAHRVRWANEFLGGLGSQQTDRSGVADTLAVPIKTLEVLSAALEERDGARSSEAANTLVTQLHDMYGPDSPVLSQILPVVGECKQAIERGDLDEAQAYALALLVRFRQYAR